VHLEDYGKHGKKEEISYFIFCFFKCPPFFQNTNAKAYAPPGVNVPSGTSGITKVDVKTQTFVDAVNSKQFPIQIRSSLSHHLNQKLELRPHAFGSRFNFNAFTILNIFRNFHGDFGYSISVSVYYPREYVGCSQFHVVWAQYSFEQNSYAWSWCSR
jgi:hypothetical protein